MRKLLVGGLIFAALFWNCIAGSQSVQQTTEIKRETLLKVGQAMQQKVILVPEYPLEYDVKIDWELQLDKKPFTTVKNPAFLLIEPNNSQNGKKVRYDTTATGSLKVPKGFQYRLTVCAGEYKLFYKSVGAIAQLKTVYPEALVQYSQTGHPYTFDFEVLGPEQIKKWKWEWEWDNNESSIGKKVTHSFEGPGQKTIILESGRGNAKGQRFLFEITAPPVIAIDPVVTPLQGPCDLTVKATIGTAVLNYNQTPSYSWDFGDGTVIKGATAGHTYTRPGKYNIILQTLIAGQSFFRNWLVAVDQISIKTNGTIAPLSGTVPLEVTATANPIVKGGPTNLSYEWQVDGLKYPAKNIKHTFKEPGEYQVVLAASDQSHPDVKIPLELFTVTAGPPRIIPNLQISASQGIVPLKVNFNPNCQVQGAPVNLKYRWAFGDNTFSVLERPSHIYQKPGEYPVQLIISDAIHPGNVILVESKISVLPPKMTVTAAANITKGTVPLNVNFSSQITINGTPCDPVYVWNFGDGATDVAQNPAHYYTNEGIHPVTLEVNDRLHPGNTVKTTLQIETRLPKLHLTTSVTPVNGRAPLQVKFQAWGEREGRANPKFSYIWEFGDGQSASGWQTSHIYKNPGRYEAVVTVVDEELNIRESKKIKVTAK
jgi:PKD repeat protein